MTDEQIKQNAEAYINKMPPLCDALYESVAKEAFIAGAHSRDEEFKQWKESKCKLRLRLMQQIHELRNPWISVEERLPEELQMVFVHMQGGSFDSAIYTNGAFERSLRLQFGMKDEGYTIISWEQKFKSNITHWMPIPELKEE